MIIVRINGKDSEMKRLWSDLNRRGSPAGYWFAAVLCAAAVIIDVVAGGKHNWISAAGLAVLSITMVLSALRTRRREQTRRSPS